MTSFQCGFSTVNRFSTKTLALCSFGCGVNRPFLSPDTARRAVALSPQTDTFFTPTVLFSSTAKRTLTQAYVTMEYDSFTPEIATIHAITAVNGQVRYFLPTERQGRLRLFCAALRKPPPNNGTTGYNIYFPMDPVFHCARCCCRAISGRSVLRRSAERLDRKSHRSREKHLRALPCNANYLFTDYFWHIAIFFVLWFL